jgi:hypothetical protein
VTRSGAQPTPRSMARVAEPVASAVPWLAAVPTPRLPDVTSRPTDVWARHLSLLLSVEIRAAVIEQTLTAAEAEQLLARLVLVIDQAITTTQA